jgi:hypothetical protein
VPLAPLERFFPLLWIGFWVNAATGVVLLAADATTKFTNPDFYVKMAFIALSIVFLQIQRKRLFRDPLVDKRPLLPTPSFLLSLQSFAGWAQLPPAACWDTSDP